MLGLSLGPTAAALRAAGWHPPGATLALDFLAWRAYAAGLGAPALGAFLDTVRASPAGVVGADGVFGAAAAGVPRRDHDAAGVPRGLRCEGPLTSHGVNSLLAGAVAGVVGAGGALPTGWIIGRPSGLTETITLGATLGIPWARVRIAGTAASTAAISIFLNPSTGVAAAAGQVWRHALYVAVSRDDPAVNALQLQISERTAGGAFAAATGATSIYAERATWGRRSIGPTLAHGSTANIQQQIATGAIASGTAIDWEIQIGGATLTQTPSLPSLLLVGTGGATRAGDDVSVALGDWFDPLAGTLVAEWMVPGDPGAAFTAACLRPGDGAASRIELATGAGHLGEATIADAVGGTSMADAAGAAYAFGAVRRHALAWQAGDARQCVDGTLGAPDGDAAVPAGLARLQLGARTGASGHLGGWLRRVAYWPVRLDDARMQALTAA